MLKQAPRSRRTSLFPNPGLRNGRIWAGLRVGIFGGSFNPPHDGHRLIAERALKELKLDCLWWLVSPQNPLKKTNIKDDFDTRMEAAAKLCAHPRMIATDLEKKLGTTYSYETVTQLCRIYPKTDFIWIAGLDNARIFHRWDQWQALMQTIPFVFYNRPPCTQTPRRSRLSNQRKNNNAYFVLQGPTRNISSTQIRNKICGKSNQSGIIEL